MGWCNGDWMVRLGLCFWVVFFAGVGDGWEGYGVGVRLSRRGLFTRFRIHGSCQGRFIYHGYIYIHHLFTSARFLHYKLP